VVVCALYFVFQNERIVSEVAQSHKIGLMADYV
jgi:hypothetical protein